MTGQIIKGNRTLSACRIFLPGVVAAWEHLGFEKYKEKIAIESNQTFRFSKRREDGVVERSQQADKTKNKINRAPVDNDESRSNGKSVARIGEIVMLSCML